MISETLHGNNPEFGGLQRQVPDQKRDQIYELSHQYLQLGYYRGAGGGGELVTPSNPQSSYSGQQQETDVQADNDDQPDPSSELNEVQPMSHSNSQRR